MNSLIAPSKELGYSDIYLDFVNGSDKTRSLYPAESLEKVAAALDKIEYNRDEIADILHKQNKLYGAGNPVFENIEKIREKNCLSIFAGQQAGLFGGPLLIMIKALAIVKAAKSYSQKLNRPVIPVFWIAGDDHDYKEVNHTFLLNRNTDLIELAYRANPKIENSTSDLFFEDQSELNRVIEQYKETLGETDFTEKLYEMIDTSYTPDDNYVSAIGKFLSKLTSEYGLVLFSPGDESAKKSLKSFFKKIITHQDKIHTALESTNEKLLSLDYHLQVEKKENSVHLFYNSNGRKPIMREGDSFVVDDMKYSKEEMLSLIEKYPEKFSPDVITKPLMQSCLFPVLSQKGGAAEIAYLAQMHKLFDIFDLVTPYYKARPTVSLVERRFETLTEEHDIKFNEIIGDIEQLINRILLKSFPGDIELKFKAMKSDIENQFKKFADTTLEFDKNLEGVARQSYGKIDYTLKMFEEKVFSSHKKKSQQTRDKIYRLWNSLYPNRNFQERSLNIGFFISKYGFDFVDFLYKKIDSEETSHQLIYLTEFEQ